MKRNAGTAEKKKGKSNRQANWALAHRWAAVGTIAAYSAMGGKTINTAHAQTAPQPNAGAAVRSGRIADLFVRRLGGSRRLRRLTTKIEHAGRPATG